jgi:aminoglycoside phosphotransferase
VGAADARVYRRGNLVIKLASSLDGDAERLKWMAAHGLPVPAVVASGPGFLVMTALSDHRVPIRSHVGGHHGRGA